MTQTMTVKNFDTKIERIFDQYKGFVIESDDGFNIKVNTLDGITDASLVDDHEIMVTANYSRMWQAGHTDTAIIMTVDLRKETADIINELRFAIYNAMVSLEGVL